MPANILMRALFPAITKGALATIVLAAVLLCGPAYASDGAGPADVERFIERMDRCEGYWTADGSESVEMRAEIAKAATEFQCESLSCDHKKLVRKYEGGKSAKDIDDVMALVLPADSKFYTACKNNS